MASASAYQAEDVSSILAIRSINKNVMKILEAEFRKELYKNLVEAGYDKQEAQKIVGTKYFAASKEKVLLGLNTLSDEINNNTFNQIDETFIAQYNSDMVELKKMHDYLNA